LKRKEKKRKEKKRKEKKRKEKKRKKRKEKKYSDNICGSIVIVVSVKRLFPLNRQLVVW